MCILYYRVLTVNNLFALVMFLIQHSEEARWVTLDEYEAIGRLRDQELLEWGRYLENGGPIAPMSSFTVVSVRIVQ